MTENELIESIQKDVSYWKKLTARIARKSADLVTINHKEGRPEASADAMEWQADVVRLQADMLLAHSKSSKSLVNHYGAGVVAAGPFR